MTLGISWVDPDAIKRMREQAQEEAKATSKAARDAARQPLPRKRMTCPDCRGRGVFQTPEHTVKRCQTCGSARTVEVPL